jgi:hypothetical protein
LVSGESRLPGQGFFLKVCNGFSGILRFPLQTLWFQAKTEGRKSAGARKIVMVLRGF